MDPTSGGSLHPAPNQDAEKISADPAYGKIVCFLRAASPTANYAMRSTPSIPPAGLGGLRRRTRVMNGRCQGFFCGAEVQTMLGEARPMNTPITADVAVIGGGPAGLTATDPALANDISPQSACAGA